jgi:uncharacterized protein YbjT (DUF2867 family)
MHGAPYAVAGASGNTGAAVALSLLERALPVRVILRDTGKGRDWVSRGAEIAVADLEDPRALSSAFEGARAAYVLNPPAYAHADMFARAETIAAAVATAAARSTLPRLVVLSSIGAHLRDGTGNIGTNRIFEERLAGLEASVAFLRPAYFMENWAWVAETAAREGVLPSFLDPLDRRIPMVSTADVGRTAAGLMAGGDGEKVIELRGPDSYSPADAAAAFSKALGRPVRPVAVPEADWPSVLSGSGFSPRTIEAWAELFRGFNTGRIAFEHGEDVLRRGQTTLEEAVAAILRKAGL